MLSPPLLRSTACRLQLLPHLLCPRRHWNAAFSSSAALWSDVRADFARLSQGLLDRDNEVIRPDAAAEFDKRMESLAAWLARRTSLLRSLHIVWPSQDSGVSLASLLQQPMPRLSSLAIQCSDRDSDWRNPQPRLRFADAACLAHHQTQLTALTFGRAELGRIFGHITDLTDEPAMMILRRLHLPGVYLQSCTVGTLGQLTRLQSLALSVGSTEAQQALQAALQQLQALTSLSVAVRWQKVQQRPKLDLAGLPRLASVSLTDGTVSGLSGAAQQLEFLRLDGTAFDVEVS